MSQSVSNAAGVVVDRDLWRKNEAIQLEAPILVAGSGNFYSMNFCSEYLQAGEIKAKSKPFSRLVKEVISYKNETHL